VGTGLGLAVGMCVGVELGLTVGVGLGRGVGPLEDGVAVGSKLDGDGVGTAVGLVVAEPAVLRPMPPPPPPPPLVHLFGQAVQPPTGSTLPSASPISQPEHGAQKVPLPSSSYVAQ